MIISASRRTDIPAFYFDWFCQRLKAGYVDVVNPFNRKQVSRISLKPEYVDCIVFWTKDPAPMLKGLDALNDYKYYVQVSITPYGHDVEAKLWDKKDIISTVQELSERLGRERVVWRYDPILLNDHYTIEGHLEWFKNTLESLAPCVERCVISFIDLYAKAKKNTQGLNLHELSEEEMNTLAAGMSDIAKGSGVTLQTCSEAIDLEKYGIVHGACIDGELVERIVGKSLNVSRAKTQRPLCNCVESFDIGQYDTCIHGCRYCYANASLERARQGFDNHNPNSSVITGNLLGDEHITLHE
ncbi:DUF1848 domain-containing protein [Anaerovibrio sp. JC8]|uniref:DUF1848 domain-containing protein n=1 Tax=Anaerovibrio sp. JC8 TaxID=1240085 RepID=UPI000A108322|nr:DUF1848 domain-containing protein [Anaerovibrio sp. JC8]